MFLRTLGVFLSIIGVVVSSYLLYTKYSGGQYVCGISSCDNVNTSQYSIFMGLPVSSWGVMFYYIIFILLLKENIKIVYYFSLIGLLFSAYLTYLEIFVIRSWCQWCVLSAWITVGLFIISLRLKKINHNDEDI